MTRSVGGFSNPESPSSLAREVSKEIDSARRILLEDTIHLDNPADLYASRTLRRHSLFQGYFNRFFRQIRYGCQNIHCETPTCLSCQKRLAKGPFRRLTTLSARTLASSLASQDYPERHLCPNPLLPLQQPIEVGSSRVNVKKSRRPRSIQNRQRDGPEVNAQVPGIGAQPSEPKLTASTSDQTSHPSKVGSQTDGKQQDKDPKSFTQNLYDTLAWRLLQFRKYQDGEFLRLPPWRLTATRDDGIQSPGSRANMAQEESQGEVIDRGQQKSPSPDTRSQQTDSVEDKERRDSEQLPQQTSAHKDKLKPVKSLKTGLDKPVHNARTASVPSFMTSAHSPPLVPSLGSSQSTTDHKAYHQCSFSATGASSILFSPYATLSHFTSSNIDALFRIRRAEKSAEDEQERPSRLFGRTEPTSQDVLLPFTHPVDISSFSAQSMVHIFSTTEAVLQSFKQCGNDQAPTEGIPNGVPQPNDHTTMLNAFDQLRSFEAYPRLVFSSLWISLESAFAFDSRRRYSITRERQISRIADFSHHLKDSNQNLQKFEGKAMNDSDAVHMFKVALAALVASVRPCSLEIWLQIVELRASGHVAPSGIRGVVGVHDVNAVLAIMDAFEDELAICLMKRLIRVFASRRCLSAISEAQNGQDCGTPEIENTTMSFMETLMRFLRVPTVFRKLSCNYGGTVLDDPGSCRFSAATLEWLRNILLKEWDGKAEVSKSSVVGGALDFMGCIYSHKVDLELQPEAFYTPFLSDRLDPMEMPVQWLTSQTPRDAIHLLCYPFLFPKTALVTYFRAINHAAMSKAFESSMSTARLMIQMSNVAGRGDSRIFNRLKLAMASHLVLEIRRDNILTDSLNQLWRRERRELMKPLKVRMGMDEGEEGIDHGGVQQEFFRLAISEAMNPDYGLFSIDTATRMSWFIPCSLEPHYKFELLGLLVSLAIYNGLALPITFPLALYRKLLDLPVTGLQHIQDGWPDLSKGFKEMLEWPEDNVESVFTVSYTFSADAPGAKIFVDMDQIGREDVWPLDVTAKGKESTNRLSSETDQVQEATTTRLRSSMASPQPSNHSSDGWIAVKHAEISLSDFAIKMGNRKLDEKTHSNTSSGTKSVESDSTPVNNANRANYVEDYIFWLTDKSIRPQYEAFARGFYTCLDKKALSIFTPETLQTLIEGGQDINLDELEQTTRYEGGWSAEHRVIKDFWSVVRGLSRKKVQRLLEFVTASGRIPVHGVKSIMFVIQRSGTDDERLPTSYTCFGRLLLPEYSTRKVLKERLGLAIANCQGFGVQ